MRKRKYLKRIVAIICIAIINMSCILAILNRITYNSLEDNLQENLITIDKQRVYALEKQFSVFSTSMKGLSTSINQICTKGVEKDKIKLRILLSDLCTHLGATVMGICDENGKAVVGTDIDFKEYKELYSVIRDKKEKVIFTEEGPQGERECILFAVPILNDESNKDFVLYASIASELITSVFNASTTYKNQNIMLVQKGGAVILPMDDKKFQEEILKDLDALKKKDSSRDSEYKRFIKEIKKDDYAIERFDIKGYGEQYIATVQLSGLPWYMISAVPTKETDTYINSSTRSLNILFSIMLVLFLGIIIFIQVIQYKNQEKVFDLAYFDKVTKLYNWDYMQIRLEEKERLHNELALLVIDIKGLKYINEIHGYNEGQRVIKSIADSMRKYAYDKEKYYMFGQLSDNNFGLIIQGKLDDNLLKWCRKYVKDIKEQISDSFEVNLRAAIAPLERTDYCNYQKTVDNVYTALETQKGKADYSIGIYNQELKDEKLRQNRLENDLNDAIKNREFKVYYQPQYDAVTEKIVGAEALVRWQHSELGFLPPGMFIPIFENNGMIGKIDMYVLEEVCRKIKEWKKKYDKVPIVSINISRAEINDRNLVKTIKKLSKRYDIESKNIKIEITESSLLNDEERLYNISKKLHNAGFGLAIDDFGTGYSSLAQLIKMPLDTIKLDKSFLDSYEKEGDGSNVHVFICDVIQIAKHIECHVVAEGVETKGQRDMLAEAGCDIIQGYYYGKPMPEEEFEKLLYDSVNNFQS